MRKLKISSLKWVVDFAKVLCRVAWEKGLVASQGIYRCRQIQPTMTRSWGKESYLGVGWLQRGVIEAMRLDVWRKWRVKDQGWLGDHVGKRKLYPVEGMFMLCRSSTCFFPSVLALLSQAPPTPSSLCMPLIACTAFILGELWSLKRRPAYQPWQSSLIHKDLSA